MSKRTLEFLNLVLEGNGVSSTQLDDLVNDRIREDQYLDYKDGRILDDRSSATGVIREYLSAFANSDGGVLIIGINNTSWTITGAKAPGGGSLDEWASDCIKQIAPYFSPLPRFQVVAHPQGNILIAGIGRSLNLVPNPKGSSITYHIRMHDKTLSAPEYLISDLVLGRRQHPLLQITDFQIDARLARETDLNPYYTLSFGTTYTIENESLYWTRGAKLGIVSYNFVPIERPQLSRSLRSYINVIQFDESKFPIPYYLTHFETTATPNHPTPFYLIIC